MPTLSIAGGSSCFGWSMMKRLDSMMKAARARACRARAPAPSVATGAATEALGRGGKFWPSLVAGRAAREKKRGSRHRWLLGDGGYPGSPAERRAPEGRGGASVPGTLAGRRDVPRLGGAA